MATTAAPAHVRDLRLFSRRTLARRPEAWVYAVAVGAAVVLLAHSTAHRHNVESSSAGLNTADGAVALMGAWAGWMLMVLAMMLPVIAPNARQVAMRSLWRRRHRAIVGYLIGYLAVWGAIGAAIVGILDTGGQAHPPAGAVVASLVGAALWQTSQPRRRVMRRCGILRLGAIRGRAADRDCAAAGWRAGRRCAFTCGPVTAAMAVGHHSVVLMGGLSVLLLTERARGPNPAGRAGRPLEAWCLVGYAATFSATAML